MSSKTFFIGDAKGETDAIKYKMKLCELYDKVTVKLIGHYKVKITGE